MSIEIGMRPFYSPGDRTNPHIRVPVTPGCSVAPSLWVDANPVLLKLSRRGDAWEGEGLAELLVWAPDVQKHNWHLMWPCYLLILDSYDITGKGRQSMIPPLCPTTLMPLSEHAWLIGVLITPQKPT